MFRAAVLSARQRIVGSSCKESVARTNYPLWRRLNADHKVMYPRCFSTADSGSVTDDLARIMAHFQTMNASTVDSAALRQRSQELYDVFERWDGTGTLIPSAFVELYIQAELELDECRRQHQQQHGPKTLSAKTRGNIDRALALVRSNWGLRPPPGDSGGADPGVEAASLTPSVSTPKRGRSVATTSTASGHGQYTASGAGTAPVFPSPYASPMQGVREGLARQCMARGYFQDVARYTQAPPSAPAAVDAGLPLSFQRPPESAGGIASVEKFNLYSLLDPTTTTTSGAMPSSAEVRFMRELGSALDTQGITPSAQYTYSSPRLPAEGPSEPPWQLTHPDFRLQYALEYNCLILRRYAAALTAASTSGSGSGSGLADVLAHCRDIDSGLAKPLAAVAGGGVAATSGSGGSMQQEATRALALEYYGQRWAVTSSARTLGGPDGPGSPSMDTLTRHFREWSEAHRLHHRLHGGAAVGAASAAAAGASSVKSAASLSELQVDLERRRTTAVLDELVASCVKQLEASAAATVAQLPLSGVLVPETVASVEPVLPSAGSDSVWQKFRVHAWSRREAGGLGSGLGMVLDCLSPGLTGDAVFDRHWRTYLLLQSQDGNAAAVLQSLAEIHAQVSAVDGAAAALENLLLAVLGAYRPRTGSLSVDEFAGELKYLFASATATATATMSSKPARTLDPVGFFDAWLQAATNSIARATDAAPGAAPLFLLRLDPALKQVQDQRWQRTTGTSSLGTDTKTTSGAGSDRWVALMAAVVERVPPLARVTAGSSSAPAVTRASLRNGEVAQFLAESGGQHACRGVLQLLRARLLQWREVSLAESAEVLGFMDALVEAAARNCTDGVSAAATATADGRRTSKSPTTATVDLAELLAVYADARLCAARLELAFNEASYVHAINRVPSACLDRVPGQQLAQVLGRVEQLMRVYIARHPRQAEALLSVQDLALRRLELTCLTSGGDGGANANAQELSRAVLLYRHVAGLGASYLQSHAAGGDEAARTTATTGGDGITANQQNRHLPTVTELRRGLSQQQHQHQHQQQQQQWRHVVAARPVFEPRHYVMLCEQLASSWPSSAAQVAFLEDPLAICNLLLADFHANYEAALHARAAEELLCGCVGLFGKAAQMCRGNDAASKRLLISQAALFINKHTHFQHHPGSRPSAGTASASASATAPAARFSVPLRDPIVRAFIKACCMNGMVAEAQHHCAALADTFTAAAAPATATTAATTAAAAAASQRRSGESGPLQGLSQRMRRRARALGLEDPAPTATATATATAARDGRSKRGTKAAVGAESSTACSDVAVAGVGGPTILEPIFFSFALQKERENSQLFSDYHRYMRQRQRIRREARELARQESEFDGFSYGDGDSDSDGDGDNGWGQTMTVERVYQGQINKGGSVTSLSIESLVLKAFHGALHEELVNGLPVEDQDEAGPLFADGEYSDGHSAGEIGDLIVSYYHQHHPSPKTNAEFDFVSSQEPSTVQHRSLAECERCSYLPRIPVFLALLDYFLLKGDSNEVHRLLSVVYPLYRAEYCITGTATTAASAATSGVAGVGAGTGCVSSGVDWVGVELQMKIELLSKESINARLRWHGQDSYFA